MFDNVFCDKYGNTYSFKSEINASEFIKDNNLNSIRIPNNEDEYIFLKDIVFFASNTKEKGNNSFAVNLYNKKELITFDNIETFQVGYEKNEKDNSIHLSISDLNLNLLYNYQFINYIKFNKKDNNISSTIEPNNSIYENAKIVLMDHTLLEINNIIKLEPLNTEISALLIIETTDEIYYINNIEFYLFYNESSLKGEYLLNLTCKNQQITVPNVKRTDFDIFIQDDNINIETNQNFSIFYRNCITSAFLSKKGNDLLTIKSGNNPINSRIINI